MNWKTLSAIVSTLESGKRPRGGATSESGSIPSLGGEHLTRDGGFDFSNLKFIDNEFFESMPKGRLKKGDILIVKDGATTGKVSFVADGFPFPKAAINEHVFLVRVKPEVATPQYVYLWLRSPHGQKQILKDFRGASIGGISRAFIDVAEIPLPPLDDQKRIAYLLSKVEGLIAQRKEHLQQLDDLLKSVFLTMFGDLASNERELPITELGKFITHLTSGGRSWAKYYAPNGKRFIRSLDVQMNSIGSDDMVYVNPPENRETERTKIQTGDVLLTITGSKVGRVCYVPKGFEEGYVSQHVAIVRTKNINPVYLSYYLSTESCGQRTIKQKQYGQAKPGINLEQIRMFPILEPAPSQQTLFAMIVEKIDRIKREYERCIQSFQPLYGTLTQLAFKGELDLSRVALPEKTPEAHEEAKPIETNQVHNEMTLELPTPDDVRYLGSVDGRKATLNAWLQAYTNAITAKAISAAEFINLAQQKLAGLQADGDGVDYGYEFEAADYDHVKDWIFQNLESKHLTQLYDDANNRVQISVAKD